MSPRQGQHRIRKPHAPGRYERILELEKQRPRPTLDKIGKAVGVTRERVRQVLKLYGVEPRRAEQSRQAKIRAGESLTKKLKWESDFALALNKANQLWTEGRPARECVAVLLHKNGTPFQPKSAAHAASIATWVRQRWPGLFLVRNCEYNNHRPEISALWRHDKSLEEICSTIGSRSPGALYQHIRLHRLKDPLYCPRRKSQNRQCRISMERLSELWLAGWTSKAINAEAGYSHTNSVYYRVSSFRAKRPDLFPLRRKRKTVLDAKSI